MCADACRSKDIEKARKKGGDLLQQIEVLIEGMKGHDTEQRFLESGAQHSRRVKRIAQTHFTKIPKTRKPDKKR